MYTPKPTSLLSPLFLLLFTLTNLTSAFRLSPNATAGIYGLSIDDLGNESHTLLSTSDPSLSPSPQPLPGRLTRRAVNWPKGSTAHCNSNPLGMVWRSNLYGDSTRQGSYDAFWNKCSSSEGKHVNAFSSLAAIAPNSNTVVFMCAYRIDIPNPCVLEEFGDAIARIGQACKGSTDSRKVQSGWFYANGWDKSYGFIEIGKSFC